MLFRTPASALAIVVALAACASDSHVDATPSCGPEGHLSPRGNCLYPTLPVCTTGLRYASGGCVPASKGRDCGCPDDGNPCHETICADGECLPGWYGADSCEGPPEPEGGTTVRRVGRCKDGECCTGCWDGRTCRPGTTPDACGSAGVTCETCTPDRPDPCVSYDCTSHCERGLVNGPGCRHCGSVDEPCCAHSACDAGLNCKSLGHAGELGPIIYGCVAPDAGADGG